MTESEKFMRRLRKVRTEMSKKMMAMTIEERVAYMNELDQRAEKELERLGLAHLIVNNDD